MNRNLIAIPILLALTCCLAACAGRRSDPLDSPDVDRAAALVSEDSLAATIRYLADDRLEGRGTGTAGHTLAAAYVADRFQSLGLEPAGSNAYVQPIPFVRSQVDPAGSGMWFVRGGREERLAFARDFVLSSGFVDEEVQVEAPAVFVGYGVVAPELGYDDYAGLDVAGKVVVQLNGAPPDFPNDQRAYHSSGHVKRKDAADRGAIGLVRMRSRADQQRIPWERTMLRAGEPDLRRLDHEGEPRDVYPSLRAAAMISPAAAERLFRGAPVPLATVFDSAEVSRPPHFDLPVRIRLRTRHALERTESENVVGLLHGSDPELREEYVVYTAHLDHLGIGAPVRGDSIYNGAYDNASGVAAMIEAARAFTALPEPPRRSILFVAVTGEEEGDEGSEAFVELPPVPIDHMVANVNLDMFLMLYPVHTLVGYGAGHSSLGPVTERVLGRLDMRLVPDPNPEEVVFVRSDQFSFVRKGVPALFLVAGNESGDPAIDGAEVTRDWRRNVYHTPQDDLTQDMDLDSGARFARACFMIGLSVAEADARPSWNEGDFFGQMFGTR